MAKGTASRRIIDYRTPIGSQVSKIPQQQRPWLRAPLVPLLNIGVLNMPNTARNHLLSPAQGNKNFLNVMHESLSLSSGNKNCMLLHAEHHPRHVEMQDAHRCGDASSSLVAGPVTTICRKSQEGKLCILAAAARARHQGRKDEIKEALILRNNFSVFIGPQKLMSALVDHQRNISKDRPAKKGPFMAGNPSAVSKMHRDRDQYSNWIVENARRLQPQRHQNNESPRLSLRALLSHRALNRCKDGSAVIDLELLAPSHLATTRDSQGSLTELYNHISPWTPRGSTSRTPP
jgi:hypothetical protein